MLVKTRAMGIVYLSCALAFLSWTTSGVAQELSIDDRKKEIEKLLELPPDIPLHIRLQIVQTTRIALGDTKFRDTVKEVLKANGLTEVQTLQDKVSQVRDQYQTMRAAFGGTIPKPPSIRDITLSSPYSQFEQDVFAPINAAIQQLPTPNPTRMRLEAMTRSIVSRARIAMLKEGLTEKQKEAFAKLKINESKDPLKDLKPYLREPVLKSTELSKLNARAQAHLGGLLQAAVKQNLQPIQEDLKELQARTKEQTDTAVRTLKWVAEKQNLLAETEQKLVDLQNQSMDALQDLKTKVESIKIDKWSDLPTDPKKLAKEAHRLVTKEAGLTLLKVALYGPLSSNQTVQQIEAGYIRISSTIDAAKEMKDKFSTLVKTQADLKGTLHNYASAGTDILEIAKQIPGIDQKAISRGQEAFSKVSAGINLAGQLASGNYVAAVASIGGLFGGGNSLGGGTGPDAQVVSMLTVIQAKLDKVLENQEKMMASLDQLHNKIDLLAKTVQQNHVEVMGKLADIQEDVLLNRKILIHYIEMKTATCSLFLDRIEKVVTHTEKANVFKQADRQKQYDKCKIGMNQILGNGETLSPLFQLEYNPPERSDQEESLQPGDRSKLKNRIAFHTRRFALLEKYTTDNSLLGACPTLK